MNMLVDAYRFGTAPASAIYLGNTPSAFSPRATSHLVSLGTYAVGDLLIIQFCLGNGIGAALTTPSGWTDISSGITFARRLTVYRVMTGSEGSTVDFVSGANAYAVAITHRIQAGTFHLATAPAIGAIATGTSTAPNPGSLTPSWGAAENLWISYFHCSPRPTVSVYPLANGNTRVEANATSDGDNIVTASCWDVLNTGVRDVGPFTIASSQSWLSQTIAVRPA